MARSSSCGDNATPERAAHQWDRGGGRSGLECEAGTQGRAARNSEGLWLELGTGCACVST